MRRTRVIAALSLGALTAAALAVPERTVRPPPEPVYVAGGQYRAELNQTTRYWTLMPLDGEDLVVGNPDPYCRAAPALPRGLWLVARSADGGLELRAASHTALPAGFPEQVALRSCGEPGGGTVLRVPQALLDWLRANAGAVYLDD